MTHLLMLYMLLGFQPSGSDGAIWRDIARVESFVTAKLNENYQPYGVNHNDPVTGYYIDGLGVVVVVPLRYRHIKEETSGADSGPIFGAGLSEESGADRVTLTKRMREWRESLKRLELERDADFEKMVTQVNNLIKHVVLKLKSLPAHESLTFVIEERQPAWFSPTLSVSRNSSRKVVTLKIDRESINKGFENHGAMLANWRPDVVRVTTRRQYEKVLP